MQHSEGFPPVARSDARVLVLGSLPGRQSIAAQQYYAHPRNAFWKIMHDLYGIDGDYSARCHALVNEGVALWDVLHASVRPGSLDADIDVRTAVVNDLRGFVQAHKSLEAIVFNGKKAESLFRKFASIEAHLPVEVNYPANNLKNLFELPVLFYGLCLYLFVSGNVDPIYVGAAWSFFALRLLHSIVHSTRNVVILRFYCYAAGAIVLWFMLGRALLGALGV